MYRQPLYSFAAPNVAAVETVTIGTQESASSDIQNLTDTQFLSFYLYLYMKFARVTQEYMIATYRSLNFNFSPPYSLPSNNPLYDDLDPYLFCYMTTLIPRNHTSSFQKYQRNKVKGIVRMGEELGLVMISDSYMVDNEVLVSVRDFMDRHLSIYSASFELLLGFANPNLDGPVMSFALEVLRSVEYAYLTGVKIIQEYIIEPNSLILQQNEIKSYIRLYNSFYQMAYNRYGDNWIFVGILDRNLWNKYSRKTAMKELYKVAMCIGSLTHSSFLSSTIDGKTVAIISRHPKYANLINMHQTIESIVLPGAEYTEQDRADIQARMRSWSRQVPNSVNASRTSNPGDGASYMS